MKLRRQCVEGRVYLRYTVPYRIQCSSIYPRLSPEGSEVILCGHEQGLQILWRETRGETAASVNDEDRDDGKDKDFMSTDKIGEYEEVIETSRSDNAIHQSLNLPLGTGVRNITCLRLPRSSLQDALIQPIFLRNHLLIGLACNDGSVRLLCAPLAASWGKQSNLEQQRGGFTQRVETWTGVRLYTVSSSLGLSKIPQSVAIAMVSSATEPRVDSDESPVDEEGGICDIIIAHHSAHQTGSLHLHTVTILDSNDEVPRFAKTVLLQTVHLASPASSIDIMTSTNKDGIKLARILLTSLQAPLSVFEYQIGPSARSGRWIVSLSPGLESLPGGGVKQKAVIEGRWALGGSVIVCLMLGGEWLLFEVPHEPVTSRLASVIPAKNLLGGKLEYQTAEGLHTVTRSADEQKRLIPMTPATRQSRQNALFKGRSAAPAVPSSFGGISISLQKRANNSLQDSESISIWAGDNGIVISDFAAYWRNRGVQNDDPFHGGAGAYARKLPQVDMEGELLTGLSTSTPVFAGPKFRNQQFNVLITGEFSITVTAPIQQQRPTDSTTMIDPASRVRTSLNARDLDVGKLDRMLDVIGSNNAVPMSL